MSESKSTSTSPEEVVPGSGVNISWPRWAKRSDWQDNLAKSATHKALDIPEDDMQIHANKTGISGKAAIGIALATGLPVAGLAAMMLWNQMKEQNQPNTNNQIPIVAAPEITVEPLNLKVKWWVDENGKVQSEVIEQITIPKN